MLYELLNDIGVRVINKVKGKLESYRLRDSEIYDKLTYDIKESNGVYQLVFNIPEYALYIDKGRSKGSRMPPQKPIEDWMKKKNIPLRASYAVRHNISVRGVKPRPFLDIYDKELENISKQILDDQYKELSLSVNDIFKKHLK